MSVDTRTPRNPTGGTSTGFDEPPPLAMVKVASDPAQVIVSHASFRVQLPSTAQPRSARVAARRPAGAAASEARRAPVVGGSGGTVARRRAPVVWSGRSAPGDTAATGLLQAVRTTGLRHPETAGSGYEDGVPTQAVPALDTEDTQPFGRPKDLLGPQSAAESRSAATGTVEAPARTSLLPHMRSYGSAYEESGYGGGPGEEPGRPHVDHEDAVALDDSTRELRRVEPLPNRGGAATRKSEAAVRHAYYPGRRMNLGVVLLPLRVFLGLISVYAGMGKLCDPVYFDGGERGSMVKWLNSLHPWALAEPMRDFALQHPVGAGLTIAFLQVIAGVLTVFGLWQRVAASLGALLSAALLVTVSWKTVPAYDAPDFIYLAAWSPLIIAGAPVYSVDGRLASEAWRRLGPRVTLAALRRRVLRRGTLAATVILGLTLLVGSLLGSAVRDADRVTGPGQTPRNELPGVPLPKEPGKKRAPRSSTSPSTPGTPTQGRQDGSPAPQPSRSSDSPAQPEAGTGAATSPGSGTAQQQPSETQGSSTPGSGGAQQAPPPQRQAPQQQAPSSSGGGGPTSSGGGTTGGGAPAETGSGGGSGGGGSDPEPEGGSLGGLFG
ncbi:DoxX family membrane protein [Streptomyces sp. NPDC007088]|uniref:DoxX family protein n=1 Tax=Streptomyces sp. NPDC007088 TaxID=3364773 RepID=UPI0036BD8450